jgi:hypothetical protein
MSTTEYLTTEELATRIRYDVRTVRERLKDSVLIEGVHYIRPFGGRKILYMWEPIERDMGIQSGHQSLAIPMANGGSMNG